MIVTSRCNSNRIARFLKVRYHKSLCHKNQGTDIHRDGYLLFLLSKVFEDVEFRHIVRFVKCCMHSGMPYYQFRTKMITKVKECYENDGYITDLDAFINTFITGKNGCCCGH